MSTSNGEVLNTSSVWRQLFRPSCRTGRRYYYLAHQLLRLRPSRHERQPQRLSARAMPPMTASRPSSASCGSKVASTSTGGWCSTSPARSTAGRPMSRPATPAPPCADATTEDRWLGQAFYPVLIAEKDTLEPVLEPVARQWQMPFVSSRGYGSLKLQHDVAEMLRHRSAATGQRAVVFFISDLDPSGLDLQRRFRDPVSASEHIPHVRRSNPSPHRSISHRSCNRISNVARFSQFVVTTWPRCPTIISRIRAGSGQF